MAENIAVPGVASASRKVALGYSPNSISGDNQDRRLVSKDAVSEGDWRCRRGMLRRVYQAAHVYATRRRLTWTAPDGFSRQMNASGLAHNLQLSEMKLRTRALAHDGWRLREPAPVTSGGCFPARTRDARRGAAEPPRPCDVLTSAASRLWRRATSRLRDAISQRR